MEGHSLATQPATGHEQYGGIGTYLYGRGLITVSEPGNLQGHFPTSAQSGGQTQYSFNDSSLQSALPSVGLLQTVVT